MPGCPRRMDVSKHFCKDKSCHIKVQSSRTRVPDHPSWLSSRRSVALSSSQRRRRKAWIFRSWRHFSLRSSSRRMRLRRQRASQLAPSIAILLLPTRRGWLRLFSRTQSWTARWPNRSTSSARSMGVRMIIGALMAAHPQSTFSRKEEGGCVHGTARPDGSRSSPYLGPEAHRAVPRAQLHALRCLRQRRLRRVARRRRHAVPPTLPSVMSPWRFADHETRDAESSNLKHET